MSLCRATLASGKACQFKAKVGSQFCGRHAGATIVKGGKKKSNNNNNAKMPRRKINQTAVLVKLREKMKTLYDITYEDWEIVDPKLVTNQGEIKKFMNEVVKESVHRFVLRDRAIDEYGRAYSYLWDQPDVPGFNRSIWLRISWNLDEQDYEALTATCRSLNRLLIQDKAWFARHPLRKIVHVYKIFHMPLFRLLYIPVPKELPEILQRLKLPSVQMMIDDYVFKNGPFKSNLVARQFEGEIIKNLLEKVLSMQLLDDEDIKEVVPGAGLFQNIKTKTTIELLNPVKHMKFVLNGETWILLHTNNENNATNAISNLLNNLVGYDEKHIYRTLRFL